MQSVPVLEVTLLGGLCLRRAGCTLSDADARSLKMWGVLCYLILHRDRSVSQSELIDLFWTEENRSNPTSALKTLLHRTRAMLEPLFPNGPAPILSQRGSYLWNPLAPCRVDVEEFDRLCTEAESPRCPDHQRLELFGQAEALYKGDFLPKLAGQLWTAPISAHCRTLYLEGVKHYAALLEAHSFYPQMEGVCMRACRVEPLDEELYILLIRAMLRQGKNAAALNQYEVATDLLYRSLGVHPSPQLRELYREIMNVSKELETDLELIQSQLSETASLPGAFVCEYGFFQQIYRLEARRASRSGSCIHVALLTVSLPGGRVPPLNMLNSTMDQLMEVLVRCLRRGDVVSRYSSAQYVIMLPGANFEDASMVMDRILTAFSRQHRRSSMVLAYKVRAMQPN